jgi:hypothetical protein
MNQTHITPNSHPEIFLNSVSNLRKYSYLKLFPRVWYPAELCSAGSDTPQDFVRRSIRPSSTLFCRVSDPAEQVSAIKYTHLCHCSAGSDTPQELVLWGLIPHWILFCRVWYLAGFCSAGYQTPLTNEDLAKSDKKVLRACHSFKGTLFENRLHV